MHTGNTHPFTIAQLLELGFTRKELEFPKRVWFSLFFSRTDMPNDEIRLEINDEGAAYLLIGDEFTKIPISFSSIDNVKRLIMVLQAAHNCPKTTIKFDSYIFDNKN